MTTHLEPWPYPAWIAHRGAGQLAPENTLAAFRMGADRGYRMFECDAKLSRDGLVFLLHDADLNRTTNATGPAGVHTWEHLSQLDAGGWHSPAFAGEPLPRLETLAHFCLAHGYGLNIEIKPSPDTEALTGAVVAQTAARLWAKAELPPLLTSFKTEALIAAQRTAPHLPRGLLVHALWEGWLDTALQIGCRAVVLNHTLWHADAVAQAHAQGLRCLAYTVNDPARAQALIDCHIDGLITDRVDLFDPTTSFSAATR